MGGEDLRSALLQNHHVLHPGEGSSPPYFFSAGNVFSQIYNIVCAVDPVPALSSGNPATPRPSGCKQQELRHSSGWNSRGSVGGSRHCSQRLCRSVTCMQAWRPCRKLSGYDLIKVCAHGVCRSHSLGGL